MLFNFNNYGGDMNRLDLIIENIEYAKLVTEQAHKDELLDEALAAARELQALKPVAFIENHKAGQNLSWSQDDLPYAKATPLYALDFEVTK
jgi:hypothetical protein